MFMETFLRFWRHFPVDRLETGCYEIGHEERGANDALKNRPNYGVAGMDERAAVYMSGAPEAAINDAYADGPTPYSRDLIEYMSEGDVLVGKRRDGSVVFREQLVGGKMVPWSPA
jgi:hypothetical protein